MKNNYQEFFLSSNPKEIEQAKKKRSALISLFPKRLGEKDETTYVLLNEEKPKQSVFFEDKTTGILNSGVVSNESKAPKEQQDKQTLKVPGFNDGKSGTPFTNYNPEQKNIFSGLFNPKPQANERKPVHDTKVAPAANDSLKIDSTRANAHPSSTLSTNTAHNRSVDNNTAEINDTTQSNNTLKLLYLPTKGRYTHQVNELKAQLPKGVQNVLNELGTEIRVGDELHTLDKDSVRTDRNGIYNANKITLDSKHVNYETLFAEAMHAVQDYLGILGYSNAEFQEHVVKDMYFKHIGAGRAISTTWDEDNKFSDFMDKSFTSEANDTIDINRFLEEVPNQIEGFKERYKDYPKYSSNFKDDFNYNWIDLFNILGIPLKFK